MEFNLLLDCVMQIRAVLYYPFDIYQIGIFQAWTPRQCFLSLCFRALETRKSKRIVEKRFVCIQIVSKIIQYKRVFIDIMDNF
ncbi:hypothetical protein Ahy_A10g047432 isoform E [Arachis hypogaea]|uniref:Uncharacterized protein n=1 Tax=Arachis hypogaea TaxID=3818 RepID=A0A445B2L8_ARAHY|nr:hypothetical protein Ahy_A10g047432 isoform E [Arachis hypogaea]